MFTLRSLEPKDASQAHELLADPPVARTFGGTPFDSVDRIASKIATADPNRTLLLGAFDGDHLVGYLDLDGLPRARFRHRARVSMAVARTHWRRGVGRALLRAALRAADGWYGFVRVELGVDAENEPAIGLYESEGFVRESRRRHEIFRDGRFVDGLGLARIRPGFVAPCEAFAEAPVAARGPRIDVTIRARRADDAAAFARLHEEDTVLDGTGQLPFQTTSFWERIFASSPSGLRALVAVHGTELVGSATLAPMSESIRFRHVMGLGLAVKQSYQSRGVGDQLMAACIELADKWIGLERITLEVNADHPRAQALYARHGFVVEGVERCSVLRRGAYVDAVAMGRVRPRFA